MFSFFIWKKNEELSLSDDETANVNKEKCVDLQMYLQFILLQILKQIWICLFIVSFIVLCECVEIPQYTKVTKFVHCFLIDFD